MTPPPEPPAPDTVALPGLAKFLAERRDHITRLWIEAVRLYTRLGTSDGVSDVDLADHLPMLFEDLEALLRGEEVAGQLAHHAELHGEHRWQQQYSLEEVLKELGIVCRVLLKESLDVFEDEHPDTPREQLHEARERILTFFEDAAAGSVRRYANKQREQLDVAHSQTRESDRSLATAVQNDRDRLAEVFQRSPSFIALLKGPEHVFELANEQYQQLVGGRDVLGQSVRQALPEVVGQGFFALLDQVYTTGEPYVGNDVRIMLQSEPDAPAKEHFLDFVYLPTRSPAGVIDGIFVHGVDWTERKTAQRTMTELSEQRRLALDAERVARGEAERISRVKDEFLATLSHELRTPLNAILGWTQVLRGDPANTADTEAGLATIERNAKAQTQIIEDLLDMSKIISGKVRLNVERLDLAALVEGAVETARPAATAKQIRLRMSIDPQVSTVSGDSNRLQQVFWNLLSNAIKFTPKGGSVQVGLDRIDSHLEVRVVDSGEGIAPEFLPAVFDKFRQQDASTTRQHGGLGLGLAIVKQLVELHGGSVQVESAGLGQGATFVVTLSLSVLQPAAEPEETGHRARPGTDVSSLSIPTESLRLEGIKVLVVDDEPDARALVKRLLENRQAQVTTAGSVAEAMERFQAERPEVLVSDIGMPQEDGYSLIRKIRALAPEHGGSTPAIALTAYARAEDRLKALMAGFQVHAAKPVDATELLVLVATLVGRADNF